MADRDLACQELVELVTAYLEDALPVAERHRFERHIAECEGCRIYLNQMRHTIQLTGSLSTDSVEPAGMAVLLEAFRGWRR